MHKWPNSEQLPLLFNGVNSQYTKESRDEVELQSIIDIISRYDVYDFITRLSALNLLIENQNKTILIDALLEGILLRPRSSYTSKVCMSSGKFRSIIKRLDNLLLKRMIDPAENAFIERVRYYGNYWIFSGTNYSPGYCLQGFLNVLFLRKNNFNQEFIENAHQLTNFILFISDMAAQNLGYDLRMIKHVCQTTIRVPDAELMAKLQYCIRINYELIENLIEDISIRENLFSDFKSGTLSNVLAGNWQDFFSHPFIKTVDESVIILNPSILVPFLISQLIVLSDKYGVKEQFINAYNNELWQACRRDLRKLGHKKIDEKAYGISLINNRFRKEEICTVGNDKIIIAHFICDAGDDYNSEDMFDDHKLLDNLPLVRERAAYFMTQLPQIQEDNVYQIVIINSFGRRIGCGISKEEMAYTISLSPAELHFISINEHKRENFIPRYIDAKRYLSLMLPPMFSSELNSIEVYTQNDYSFYISDDFNPKTTHADFGFEWTLDYVIRAIQKEDRHLIESYDGEHLSEIVLSDSVRNIYLVDNQAPKAPEIVVKFERINIWFTTDSIDSIDQLNIVAALTDAMSYWLAECNEIINRMVFIDGTLRIHISLNSPINEYFGQAESEKAFFDCINYKHCDNTIHMMWSAECYLLFGKQSNNVEKEMIHSLLIELQKYSSISVNLDGLDELFTNPLKRKVYAVNVMDSPYLNPTYGSMRNISPEEENRLLNEIGDHFLSLPEYDYGYVPDDKRAELANKVVGYLYSILQAEISSVKPDGLYERVCFDLETVMYHAMLSQKRYAYDISCYPEHSKQIIEQYNETNKSSVALKFLAEYIAAVPPDGEKILGAMKYDRILAICSLIVDWAYRNDLFRYNIINSPIHFLKSRRIGMPKEEHEYLSKINAVARSKHLEHLSDPNISVYSPAHLIKHYQADLDEAFIDEYKFSFQQFLQCIFALADYGDGLKGDVKRVSRSIVIDEISRREKIPMNIVSSVIDQITLTQRADYLTPPAPFVKYDVYPWRFNRELSFTRRPIIQYKDDLIWGNRQLHHMWRYTIDLIIAGKYKARKNKLKKLIGKLGDKRGNDFNSVVVRKLSECTGLIVCEKLSKINGKKIAGIDGNVLGDIDVFYIVPDQYKIVVGEIKDFSFAKNPYEMDQEYKRIFVDSDKPCYMTKHKRRATWIEEHLDDVIHHFQLPDGPWTVKTVMFVSEEIVSNAFYHQRETIIVYSEITKESATAI